MSFTFRPAVREHTPLIIGLAGPTKSGKTYSAHRLAAGLAKGGKVIMINTEGPKGHNYANKPFKYIKTDMDEPFSLARYEEAFKAAIQEKPAVIIIDSMSHAHEGAGGLLDQHEAELDRMAGNDYKRREKMTWAAWVKPKQAEASFINTIIRANCHVILCFRAKEKLKIVKGQDPVNLGWQPIASDRMSFETLFTLVLPPRPPGKKGVPDMDVSELREPFDTMIPKDKQLDERLGGRLAEWAMGEPMSNAKEAPPQATAQDDPPPSEEFDPPTPEEVEADLKRMGMVDEVDPMAAYKKRLAEATSFKEINAAFKEFVSNPENGENVEKASTLATNRQQELKKAA